MKSTMEFTTSISPTKSQIIDEINDYVIEVCLSDKSKKIAYKLRYDAYIKSYPNLKNDTGLLFDHFDDAPN
ncbi:MAG: hypothetical protein CMO01_12385, partial [Thalassobius sp.]|nr:hypothetical protein [Thalassovita sp.]